MIAKIQAEIDDTPPALTEVTIRPLQQTDSYSERLAERLGIPCGEGEEQMRNGRNINISSPYNDNERRG